MYHPGTPKEFHVFPDLHAGSISLFFSSFHRNAQKQELLGLFKALPWISGIWRKAISPDQPKKIVVIPGSEAGVWIRCLWTTCDGQYKRNNDERNKELEVMLAGGFTWVLRCFLTMFDDVLHLGCDLPP